MKWKLSKDLPITYLVCANHINHIGGNKYGIKIKVAREKSQKGFQKGNEEKWQYEKEKEFFKWQFQKVSIDTQKNYP